MTVMTRFERRVMTICRPCDKPPGGLCFVVVVAFSEGKRGLCLVLRDYVTRIRADTPLFGALFWRASYQCPRWRALVR